METTPTLVGSDLAQLRAYTVEDVEMFLAAADVERERLCEAVADAHARVLSARDRLAASTALRDRLGTMMLDAQRTVISRRADVDIAVARIVEAAEAEAEALVASARAEVAAARSRSALHRAARPEPIPAVIDLSLRSSEVV